MSKLEIEYVGSLYGHNDIVTSIVVGKDSNGKPLVISGARDRKIIVWKLNLDAPVENTDETKPKDEKVVGTPFKLLSGHSHFVSSLAISKDSNSLVSGSWDKTVRLWDLNTFKTKKLLVGHKKDVLSVSFSPDSRFIISGSMDNSVKFWNIEGEVKHSVNDFGGWVSSINHIKKGDKSNLIAVGSWDQTVRLYDPKSFQNVLTIGDFDYGVVSTGGDDDGEFLFSGEKNGKIRVHKISEDKTELKSTIDVNADLNAISFESKYYMTISCATSKGLIINEVNKQNHSIFEKRNGPCHSLAWDETKTYLFAGFADGVIRVIKFKDI